MTVLLLFIVLALLLYIPHLKDKHYVLGKIGEQIKHGATVKLEDGSTRVYIPGEKGRDTYLGSWVYKVLLKKGYIKS